jgi:hypothetical protein
LRIRPQPSARLTAFLALVHGAALVVVAALPLDWPWRLGLGILVLLGLLHAMAAHLLYRLPWAPREAVWQGDGRWELTLVSGREIEAILLTSTYVRTSLIVLNFRCHRILPCSLVLFRDALDEDLARRLRVRLRLHGTSGTARPGPEA